MSNKINTPKNENINFNEEIKYPFSGIAPNLIDKFLVLGYDKKTIGETYQKNNIEPSLNFKTHFIFFEFEERPNIVNEISNDYSKDLLDNDLILELIFPNNPQMYFLEKKYMNKPRGIDEEFLTNHYSIIFSINPQDNYGSKKSYNGLGFVFYSLQEKKEQGETVGCLYIPTAYVILSEFPYFYQFNEICKNIYTRIRKENDEIPIDIIIYNTIKFVPSPINKSINLFFGNHIGVNQNSNMDVETIIENLNSTKNDRIIPSLFFSQLSGYPYVDINMSFIFNLIPPEIIIEVFIFSFLEHDIIFYSSKPEFLNVIMYIFACFNFPFNDSIYYWHILSVSQESFMSGTSTFVGKTSSTITGILSEYDPEIMTTKKIKEHFVLDIDNKNFFFLYQEENEEVKETMELYTYIKNCSEFIINEKEIHVESNQKDNKIFNDGFHLYDCIKYLLEELIKRSKKVTSTDYNNKKIKPNFFNLFEDESEIACIKSNQHLQEAFLIFILQITKNFLNFRNPKRNENVKGMESIFEEKEDSFFNEPKIDEKTSYSEEEKKKLKSAKEAGRIFRAKFMDCSKYNSFVINYCIYHETIDLYKIPYNFINELIYYSHFFSSNINEVQIFKLIDQFYGKKEMLPFQKLVDKKKKKMELEIKKEKKENEKKEKNKNKKNKDLPNKNIQEFNILNSRQENEEIQNIYLFSFDKFSKYYQKNLRDIINREQEDDKENFSKVKTINKQYKTYKRNNYFLSQKILNIYITFIYNNLEELLKTFELEKCHHKRPEKSHIKNIESCSLQNINIDKSNNIDLKGDSKQINSLESMKEIKNKEIVYLIQNKLNKDSALRKNLFGTYNILGILDTIEYNFIILRFFSSFTLIKFSLLNVIAVTRVIESKIINNQNVIQIICDFCDITKLVVKKYINIYLYIFKEIQQKNLRENSEIEECIKKISLLSEKKNINLTEEKNKISNELKGQVNSSDIDSISETDYSIDILGKKERLSNDFIEYIKKNGKFFEFKKNSIFPSKKKEYQNALNAIETIYLGGYEDDIFGFIKDSQELAKLFEKNKSNNNKKFIPKTPILLYDSSNKILKKYLENVSNETIPYNELYNDILSLIFYFKIPVVGFKWIEKIKEKKNSHEEEKKNKSDKKKNDKHKKKNKEKISLKDESIISEGKKEILSQKEIDINELEEILYKIIAILYDLITSIEEKVK